MATKKLTGIPEIDMIASAFAKKFGKEEVLTMGPKYEKVEPISTGSVSLDSILGIGGVPDDRIIEVFGPPSAGKTSLCLQIVRNYVQAKG
jgi:recombination protein RecA